MDIEQVIVDHLNSQNLGATAYYNVPKNRPASFLTVERVGGGAGELVIERPRVVVQAWGPSRVKALELAANTDLAMREMVTLPNVFYVAPESKYRDDDPDSGQARYSLQYTITINN